jgi:hypothetical protein
VPEAAARVDDACVRGAVAVDEPESDEEPEALDELDAVGGCGATVVAAPTLEIAMKFPTKLGFPRLRPGA